MPAPARIEDLAAPQSGGRRGTAQHVAVPPHGHDRRFEPDLDRPRLPGDKPPGSQRPQAAHDLAGVEVEPRGHEAANGGRRVGEERAAGEEAGRGREGFGRAELHAAGELLQADAGELERRALAGLGHLPRLAVHLDAAHPHLPSAGEQLQRVSGTHGAARQRPRHHDTQPLEMEGAVDGQPRRETGIGRCRVAGREVEQGALQLGDPLARGAGDGEDGGAGEAACRPAAPRPRAGPAPPDPERPGPAW